MGDLNTLLVIGSVDEKVVTSVCHTHLAGIHTAVVSISEKEKKEYCWIAKHAEIVLIGGKDPEHTKAILTTSSIVARIDVPCMMFLADKNIPEDAEGAYFVNYCPIGGVFE